MCVVKTVEEGGNRWRVEMPLRKGDSAWRPLQLPVERPWSMPGGPFVCFLAQTGVENAPFTL